MSKKKHYYHDWQERHQKFFNEMTSSVGAISAMISGLKNKDKIKNIRDWCNWLLK